MDIEREPNYDGWTDGMTDLMRHSPTVSKRGLKKCNTVCICCICEPILTLTPTGLNMIKLEMSENLTSLAAVPCMH